MLIVDKQGPIIGGSCQMQDSFCRVKDGELWLMNMQVGKHKTTGPYFQHVEKR
jgi:tmRNA-binding protein